MDKFECKPPVVNRENAPAPEFKKMSARDLADFWETLEIMGASTRLAIQTASPSIEDIQTAHQMAATRLLNLVKELT